MYIVAIGWLFVVLMMAITAKTVFGGFMMFLFYGLFPCALLLWIIGTPQRRRNKSGQISEQHLGDPNRTNPKADE